MFRMFTLLLMILAPVTAQAEMSIDQAMVRMPPPVADNAAAYMTLHNDGDEAIEIVAVESDAAEKTEFHTMSMQNGMMHMMPMAKVIIPAHGALKLKQGGDHLMLIGLKQPLSVGEVISFRMQASTGESIRFEAPVHDLREQSQHHNMH